MRRSLSEAAVIICGDDSPQSVRWMADQLRARRFRGSKVRGHWRMSDADIELAWSVCSNSAEKPVVAAEVPVDDEPRVLSFAPTSARRRSA